MRYPSAARSPLTARPDRAPLTRKVEREGEGGRKRERERERKRKRERERV
jgi:hypothetical protein